MPITMVRVAVFKCDTCGTSMQLQCRDDRVPDDLMELEAPHGWRAYKSGDNLISVFCPVHGKRREKDATRSITSL